MNFKNIVTAPGSTAIGGTNGGLLIANAVQNADVSSPLFWLNIAAGLLSIVIGALQGPR